MPSSRPHPLVLVPDDVSTKTPGSPAGLYDRYVVDFHMRLIRTPPPVDEGTVAIAATEGLEQLPGTWRSLMSGILDVLVHGLLQQYYSRTVRDLAAEQLRIMAQQLGHKNVNALIASNVPVDKDVNELVKNRLDDKRLAS